MVDGDTPEAPAELSLASEFPTATREQWSALVDGVLRKSRPRSARVRTGRGVAKLVRPTLDGIGVRPLYTAEDGAACPGRGTRRRAVRTGRPGRGTACRTAGTSAQRHADPDRGPLTRP